MTSANVERASASKARAEAAGRRPGLLPWTTTSGSRLDWATRDEPMTGAQASYLETLSREAGEEAPPADLTKARASERIDALQQQTGRGA
jgi:DUF3072 family protein